MSTVTWDKEEGKCRVFLDDGQKFVMRLYAPHTLLISTDAHIRLLPLAELRTICLDSITANKYVLKFGTSLYDEIGKPLFSVDLGVLPQESRDILRSFVWEVINQANEALWTSDKK